GWAIGELAQALAGLVDVNPQSQGSQSFSFPQVKFETVAGQPEGFSLIGRVYGLASRSNAPTSLTLDGTLITDRKETASFGVYHYPGVRIQGQEICRPKDFHYLEVLQSQILLLIPQVQLLGEPTTFDWTVEGIPLTSSSGVVMPGVLT